MTEADSKLAQLAAGQHGMVTRSQAHPDAAKQVHTRDRNGREVARVDLGWPKHHTGIEHDSVEWHGDVAWAMTRPDTAPLRTSAGPGCGPTKPI